MLNIKFTDESRIARANDRTGESPVAGKPSKDASRLRLDDFIPIYLERNLNSAIPLRGLFQLPQHILSREQVC